VIDKKTFTTIWVGFACSILSDQITPVGGLIRRKKIAGGDYCGPRLGVASFRLKLFKLTTPGAWLKQKSRQ